MRSVPAQVSEAVAAQRLGACEAPLAEVFDLAILDLDGVVYVGRDAVPGAAPAIAEAGRRGLRSCFVTNNASRTPDTVADHLTELGVPAGPDDVVTSAQVAAALLARRLEPGSRVLVIGGTGLRVALKEAGLVPVATMDDGPAAVVQGFSPDLDWRALAQGTRAVRAGLPWVATNLDPTVPTPHGPAPGNGSLVRLIATAAEKDPDEIAGKPQPQPFLEAARRYGANSPLVVGDRLDTDLEGAAAAAMPGLAVLTGISGARDLVRAARGMRPTFVAVDLAGLLEPHPDAPAHLDGGRALATCRSARVSVDPTGVEVLATGGDALDLLRAACAAAWCAADATIVDTGAVDVTPLVQPLQALTSGATWAR